MDDDNRPHSSARASGPVGVKEMALRYAQLGWHIFPCRNKKPLTTDGFYSATRDATQIERWWTDTPDAEIACVPGPSGLLVIDLDLPKNGGGNGLEFFSQLAGPAPRATSLIARTPSGGQHLVYRMPPDRRYGMANLKPYGTDIRGFDGYVILPDGRPGREWEKDTPFETDPPEMPNWLSGWLDVTVGPVREEGQPKVYGKMSPAGTATDHRLKEVRSALFAIEPTVGRTDWLKCIYAVHDALQGDERGADLLEEWSALAEPCDSVTGSGQYREGEAVRIYASAATVEQRGFGPSPRASVSASTLFKFAANRGWSREPKGEHSDIEFSPAGGGGKESKGAGQATNDGTAKTALNPDAIRLLDWTEVAELPMVRWQVFNLIPERSMVLLAGDTMMGKSFVAIDLAMRLVHDRPFFGHKVKPCSALYLCGEGQQGLSARLRLWGEQHNVTETEAADRFFLVSNRIPELGAGSLRCLRKLMADIVDNKGHAPGLVIVDTLSQALDGDENDAAVTAPLLRALARLCDEFGCSVMMVHHIVKRDQKQAFDRKGNGRWLPLTLNQVRGSGAITRNIDTVLGVQTARNDPHVFELVTMKQKDGGLAESIQFQRRVASTGRLDENGEPETSCVLELVTKPTTSVETDISAERLLRESEDRGIQRLVEALEREGRFGTREAIVSSAGMNMQRGRVCLDIALSRNVIVDIGRSKRPMLVLPKDADRIRQDLGLRARRPLSEGGETTPDPPRDVGRVPCPPSPSPNPSNPSETERTVGTDSEEAGCPSSLAVDAKSRGRSARRRKSS